MTHTYAQRRQREGSEKSTLRRRTFLAASGVAAGGLVATNESETPPSRTVSSTVIPTDVILSIDDLFTAGTATYVTADVTLNNSPLAAYLRATTDGLTELRGGASGFVSEGVQAVPRYVESAALGISSDVETASLIDGTTDWLHRSAENSRQTKYIEQTIIGGATEWTVGGAEGEHDVFRFRRVNDDLAVYAVTSGRADAAVTPERAMRRYDRILQRRASRYR